MINLAAFDVETWGADPAFALQPCRARSGQAWLTSWAMAFEAGDQPVVVGEYRNCSVESLRKVLVRCAERRRYVVGWNTAFDVAWLIALGLREEVFACKWLDGMAIYRHMTSRPKFVPGGPDGPGGDGYGLKATVATLFPDDAGYDEGVTFDPQTDEEWDKLHHYNRLDSTHTLKIVRQCWDRLTNSQRRCILLEARCIPMVAESYVEGLAADVDAARELSARLDNEAKLAFVRLKLAAPNDVSPEVLASPAKLGELLFTKWNLPVVELTDTGKPSTNKRTLADLADEDERAKQVHEYREANNNRTKFAEGTVSSLEYNGDGMIRPQARVYGTYTGRMTYSSKQGRGVKAVPTGVALHQWKRDKFFRRLITVPEGYTLLEFDFSGQEFRWMAVESRDPVMLGLCQPGQDAHTFMGAKIAQMPYKVLMDQVAAGEPDAKPKRQLGKVGNLSLQYRTSANKLRVVAKSQHGVYLTPVQSRIIHSTYLTSYVRVPEYWQSAIAKGRLTGYAETIAGRRVFVGLGKDWDRDTTWNRESTCINFPIQGAGADQKYLALSVLRDYLPTVDGRFYFELHDGMFIIVPDRYAEKAAVEVGHLLSNLPYKQAWGVDLPIQFPVDAKLGKTWGDLKEFKQ